MIITKHASPMGDLYVTVTRGAVARLTFDACKLHADASELDVQAMNDVRRALDAYFDGDIGALDDLDLAPTGTIFQRRVWDALRRIAPGTTTSYGEIARRIGSPHAARAVGAANGANPIAIIVPCHRVVGANGALTGYAFGVDKKKWLLEHEERNKTTRRLSA